MGLKTPPPGVGLETPLARPLNLPPGVGLETPPGYGTGDTPPRCGPGGPPGVGLETPLARLLNFPQGVDLETPPQVWAWRPPWPDSSTSLRVWTWRPPWPDPSTSPLGVGLETPSVNRITDTCKNITLPQLRCGR